MGTGAETMWVGDEAQLQATVETLLGQGGEVRHQAPGVVHVHVAKQLNVPVLVGGLVLCVVPGLAYLLWYLSDKDRVVAVTVGHPPGLDRPATHLWADGGDEAAPTPPPEREPPTVFGGHGAPPPEPPAYPADPLRYPVVEHPAPPPPPPGE